LQDEETELQAHRTVDENEFATGVSFGELDLASFLLQKEELQPEEQKTVTAAVAKLVHTDLWDKVMKALPGANDKIARILEVPRHAPPSTGNWKSFDIRNFI
jgi:hypothetical protein